MRVIQIGSILAVALLVLGPVPVYAAPANVDNQWWGESDIIHKIQPDLVVTGILTTRVGNAIPNPWLNGAGIDIDYVADPWIFSAGDYYVSVRSYATGAHLSARLPFVGVTYVWKESRLLVTDRNRIEQVEGIAGAPKRYRNRLAVGWHLASSDGLTDIFVVNEVFYDFSRSTWSRDRAQAGLQFMLSPSTDLLVFYLRQHDDHGLPNRLNVIGTTLQVTF